MSLLLFANNAQTTLAGPIAASATTLNLAAGTGKEFPSPAAGQYFVMTLNDQATGQVREIIWVTALSTDTCTVVRAQEGTTAVAWLANDIAANWWTAGQAAAMIQVAQLQAQATNYGPDTGTANNPIIALTPAPTSLASLIGVPLRVKMAATNTGSSVLQITPLAATVITNPDGSNLYAGQLIGGHIAEFVFNGTTFDLMTAPYELLKSANTWAGTQAFQASIGLANNIGITGKDTSGTAHNMLYYSTSNTVQMVGGSGGFGVGNEALSAQNLSVYDDGNVTVRGVISAAYGTGFSHAAGYSANSSFTVPSGVTQIEVQVWGGGSGGWGSATAGSSSGGSGGGYASGIITGLTSGTVIPITAGAGGYGGGAGGNTGGYGGTSSFGSYLSATGGQPGTSLIGGNGGIGSGSAAYVLLQGQPGGSGAPWGASGSFAGGAGGSAPFGGSMTPEPGGGGGSNFPGGGGSGGGSVSAATAGTAGAGGYIIVRW